MTSRPPAPAPAPASVSARLLPHPVLSAVLLAIWLLLDGGLTTGALLPGALLAIALPLLTSRFWPEAPQAMRLAPVPRLAAVVLLDILTSGFRVARLVVGPMHGLRPRFFQVPLEVTSPLAITTLAGIITLTPGTLSANLSGDRRALLVHALSDDDPAGTVATIKARYERPLLEIFGC